MSIIPVSDARSNTPEQIDHVVRAIGRSKDRLIVFKLVYHGKKKIKTVGAIASRDNMTRKRVLNAGRHLVLASAMNQVKLDGDTAYEKDRTIQSAKSKILALVASPEKLKTFATKRNPSGAASRRGGGGTVLNVTLPRGLKFATPRHVTIDDIDSFRKAWKKKAAGNLPTSMSEKRFKRGLLKILCQGGTFKDWGGEQSDIYTSRLVYKGRRYRAAFALKGPGLKGKLTFAKMGKNGDQALRLFAEPADFFLVQHWREIDPSVVTLMQALATKAAIGGQRVYYGTIDGQDSKRLLVAYSSLF